MNKGEKRMIEELTYSYAATISQRIQAWKDLEVTENEPIYFNKWQARKSLLAEADYKKMLRYMHCDEESFNLGLLPFTEDRAKLLLAAVENSDWFQLHQELFVSEIPIKKMELGAAIRFHLNYFENYLRKILKNVPQIQLPEKVIKDLKDQLADELLFIAQKTLVWDVHQMIEEYHLQANTKEEEFSKYIEEFHGDKQRTFLFYGEYPTLAKILAERLTFACEMLAEFISSLEQSMTQLVNKFQLCVPLMLTEITLGQGDSHERGKTVIQFQVQEKYLIFKFKNLEIGQRFNELLTYLEELNPALSFYKIQRITYPTFTVEEKVPYKECTNEAEVACFYENYGQLLAIVYWLGSTDLHMENVIANGSNPVLIDVETLIRPDLFKQTKRLSRQNRIEKHSVLVSGLLPQKRHVKHGMEIDALSGTKQKLPKKVRRLKNDNSSDIAFQLEEVYMEGAQNIPRLGGKEVNYRLYCPMIEMGFKEMNQLLLKNKSIFIEKVKEIFTDTTIRLIYRDTQDYGNLLNFTLHPESMSNYVEREKIIENLWASKIIPEVLIPYEVEAMLNHDVPLVTANTSLTSAYTNGHELKQLLEKTPLQNTIAHMEQITEKTSNFSYLLLKESLDTLEYSTQKISIPSGNHSIEDPLLQKAADIGDTIIDQVVINRELEAVDWLSILPEQDEKIGITYPDTNFYEGSAGIYLFLVYLNQFVPKNSYQEVIDLLEKEIFLTDAEKNSYESAFFDDGMRLTVAFYVTRLLNDEKHYSYMKKSLQALKKYQIEKEKQTNEWLYGRASLLAILAAVYQTTENNEAYELLLDYAAVMPQQEMTDTGFAHGYAGVCYGLTKANEVLKNKQIKDKISWFRQKFEQELKKEEKLNDSWCRGKTGIKEVYDSMNLTLPDEQFKKSDSKNERDDCLCHGNYGNKDNHLNDIIQIINNVIKLKSDLENTPISFFCGLAGVGYQMLRAYDPCDVHSLLFIK